MSLNIQQSIKNARKIVVKIGSNTLAGNVGSDESVKIQNLWQILRLNVQA